jgi:hypothetical protein
LAREQARDIESGFRAEVNVDQSDVRAQLAAGSARLRSGRHGTDHGDALAFEQLAGNAEKIIVVIDDHASHRHAPIVPGEPGFVIGAITYAGPPASTQ